MKHASVRKGFTMIELILYVALTAIIVVALTRVLLTIIGTRERIESVSVVQQEARFAFNRIITETLRSKAILTGATLFDLQQGSLGLLSSGSGATHTTIFSLSGSTIYVAAGGGDALPLTSSRTNVTELFFHSLSSEHPPRTISIRLHAMDAIEKEGQKMDEVTFETTVSLRNR
ncbi:MAG: prepilin-type N-terminal cleavage/methylation domain-containing protein [Patescibacteria group bacterium]